MTVYITETLQKAYEPPKGMWTIVVHCNALWCM